MSKTAAHDLAFRPFTPKGAELDYKLGAVQNRFGTFARGGYESPPAQQVVFPEISASSFCSLYPYDPRNLSIYDSAVIGGWFNEQQVWTTECSDGQLYTGTVPAGTFFSTKSQADANLQARGYAISLAIAQCPGEPVIDCDDFISQQAYYYERNSPVLIFNALTPPTPVPPETGAYLAPFCLRQFDYCYNNYAWELREVYRVRSNANGGKQAIGSFWYTFSDAELEQIASSLVTVGATPFRMIFTAQMYRYNTYPSRVPVSASEVDSEGRVIEVKILQ